MFAYCFSFKLPGPELGERIPVDIVTVPGRAPSGSPYAFIPPIFIGRLRQARPWLSGLTAAFLVCVVSLNRSASLAILLVGEVGDAMEHARVRHLSLTCGEQARF